MHPDPHFILYGNSPTTPQSHRRGASCPGRSPGFGVRNRSGGSSPSLARSVILAKSLTTCEVEFLHLEHGFGSTPPLPTDKKSFDFKCFCLHHWGFTHLKYWVYKETNLIKEANILVYVDAGGVGGWAINIRTKFWAKTQSEKQGSKTQAWEQHETTASWRVHMQQPLSLKRWPCCPRGEPHTASAEMSRMRPAGWQSLSPAPGGAQVGACLFGSQAACAFGCVRAA